MARSRLARLALLPAPLFLAVLAFACSGDDVQPVDLGGGCLVNSDCSAPLICAFRRCHTQCNSDRDCQMGLISERCVEADRPYRVCQLDNETKCTYNSDCPQGEVCGIDDQCRDQCASDRDCVMGQVCVTGTCADPAELVDGGLTEADAGQTTGQPCQYNSQCSNNLVCREGICNYECLADRDCDTVGDGGVIPCVMNRCQYPASVLCIPGSQISCACIGAPNGGTQVCAPDGMSYQACDCPDGG